MANGKICSKCSRNQPFSEFYRNSKSPDGHLQKCKTCARSDDRERRDNDKVREQAKTSYHRRAATPEGRQKKIEQTRRWNEKHKVKIAAQILVHNSITAGKLVRQTVCERCNSTGHIDAHHEDYHKPLDVLWLCKRCHGLRHRELNKQREAYRG